MCGQTVTWHQWIVVDDGVNDTSCTMGQVYIRRGPGDEHSQHRNIEAALVHVTGNAIAFIEDDDWYGPNYLAELTSLLEGAEIAGFGWACKYNVRHRLYKCFSNRHQACLARTAIRVTLLDTLRAVLRRHPKYIDLELWRSATGRRLIGRTRQHIGIKGMPGRAGIERGHRPTPEWGTSDSDGVLLKEWVSGAHEVYARFHSPGLVS